MNDHIKETILKLCESNIYIKNIGLELTDMREGHITSRVPVTEAIINPYGSVHGGALYAIADITAGFTACTGGFYVSTSSGNLTYIRPAIMSDYIICEADILHAGRKVTSVSVRLLDDAGMLLDTGTFTFCMLDRHM